MKWEKGFRPDIILNKLKGVITVKKGSVSFSSFEAHEYITVLESMIVLSKDIPPDLKRGIVNRAISSVKKGQITPKSIKREVSREERNYINKPKTDYILVTSLSVSSKDQIPTFRLNGCSISFSSTLDKKYLQERADIERKASRWLYRKKPINYINVKVRIKARSEYEAVIHTLNQLDFIRGIWNLYNNNEMRISTGKPNPVNKILLGAVHTLHDPTKKLASHTYWYEPTYQDGIHPTSISHHGYKTLAFTKSVRKRLKIISYRHQLEVAIRRYVRALDHPDLDTSFLKLWGVLEFLTNTMEESYKITIKRASFVLDDSELHTQVLNGLKEYRNRYAHTGEGVPNNIESYLYQLKRYVEQLLFFHLGNKGNFRSISEAASLLNLPPDIEDLKERQMLIKEAIRYKFN